MNTTANHRNRKSAGHICFAGDFEFYRQENEHGELQVFRANRSSAFDLEGCRHGRWECAATHLDTYGFETVTGLKPEPAYPVGRAAQEADPEEWYCEDCGELIDSASAGCHNPNCGETPQERRLRELAEISPQASTRPDGATCEQCALHFSCPGRDRFAYCDSWSPRQSRTA